jgi:hypothetical protein
MGLILKKKIKSGGLHEKPGVATCNFGTISTAA